MHITYKVQYKTDSQLVPYKYFGLKLVFRSGVTYYIADLKWKTCLAVNVIM